MVLNGEIIAMISPDISLRSEYAIQETLGRHPLYRQHGLAVFLVIITSINVPGHAEIRDLDGASRVLGGQ